MKTKKIIAIALIASILSLNFSPITTFALNETENTNKTKKEKEALAKQQTKLDYINIQWWEEYNDPYLKNYIFKALENNQDLKIATLKVEESREATNLQLASELPSVSAGVSPAVLKMPGTTSSNESFSIPLIASYEADIFLKNRDKTRSAKKIYEASQLKEKATYISIAGQVGTIYYNIVNLDKLIQIQETLIEDRKNILEMTKISNKEGIASTADLVQADKAFVSATTNLYDLLKSRELLLNSLAVLIGESPANIKDFKRISYDEINVNKIIPNEISSEKITARPDYLVAQKMVEKAGIDVRIAKKEFLPSINILGLLGFQSTSTVSKMNWETAIATAAASAMLPIFTGGARVANYKINKNKYEQTLLNYQKTNLIAIQEVNDSLSVLKLDNEKHIKNLKTFEMEQKDFIFTEKKYEQGIISLLDLLQKKEALLSIEKMVTTSKTDCLINHISLYKAVAGNL